MEDGRKLLSNVISTSVKEQALYGGVVPGDASRRHCEFISATVKKALLDAGKTIDDVDAVAVTLRPASSGPFWWGELRQGAGLLGGQTAGARASPAGAHCSPFTSPTRSSSPLPSAVASGGHSHIVEVQDYTHYHILGHTVDDAAGEAFDKVARTLGLPPRRAQRGQRRQDRQPQGLPSAPHVEGSTTSASPASKPPC